MTTLWRCDACLELIDTPLEGDVRTELALRVVVDGEENETAHLDLCADCRPKSAGALADWLSHELEAQAKEGR